MAVVQSGGMTFTEDTRDLDVAMADAREMAATQPGQPVALMYERKYGCYFAMWADPVGAYDAEYEREMGWSLVTTVQA